MTEVLFISLVSASCAIFINYCIGKPGFEFSPYEIFSRYTVWLSIRRLKQTGLIDIYHRQFENTVNELKTEHEIVTLRKDYHKMLYNAAEPFFTWERMAGMCVICTGFWIALLIGLTLKLNISETIENIVLSHIIIRILNKIL